MFIIEILKAIFLGIVQGITEWLPISSTGHLILFNEFIHLNFSDEFFNMFKVVIQFGSILAVLTLYFHKLNPFSFKKTPHERKDTVLLWVKVLIATVPAGIIGLLFDDVIDSTLSTPYVIAATLIIYGVLFLIAESLNRKPKINSFADMTYTTALIIGVFQMLALIPGTSRSGATIVGAVFLGCSRFVAAEFSFFMAIPVMFGASLLKLVRMPSMTGPEWIILLVGMLVAYVVSVFVIKFLMDYIKKHDFKVFGYYRIGLGILVLIVFLFFIK